MGGIRNSSEKGENKAAWEGRGSTVIIAGLEGSGAPARGGGRVEGVGVEREVAVAWGMRAANSTERRASIDGAGDLDIVS